MVYVYTNAVEAGLVRSAREWPGAKSLPEDLVQPPVEIERPTGFYRADGPVPAKVRLQLDLPDALEDSGTDPVQLLERAVQEREIEIRSARREDGLGFLGPLSLGNVLDARPAGRAVLRAVAKPGLGLVSRSRGRVGLSVDPRRGRVRSELQERSPRLEHRIQRL